jgi:hypothetical protein
MTVQNERIALLVGGGPAPGLNGVIGRDNRGYRARLQRDRLYGRLQVAGRGKYRPLRSPNH